MKISLALLFALMLPQSLFARGEDPPASITLTMNQIVGPFQDTRHNGTFTLTGQNNKGRFGTTWSYVYRDRPENPTIEWAVSISPNDEIVVGAGSGQAGVGTWKAYGDVYTATSVPQITPKNVGTVVTIKANP